ncbi:hypothetical protein [uncultured Sneathiella sp.]|uniref:hypothetical protein n=1 Tax=uncultured Sneathiella sp. TaxID=879315 RepID=UPI0030DBFDE6
MTKLNRTISIAPMMDWTDRHDQYFLRLISARAPLTPDQRTIVRTTFEAYKASRTATE